MGKKSNKSKKKVKFDEPVSRNININEDNNYRESDIDFFKFDFAGSELPDQYGSIKGITADDIIEMKKHNHVHTSYIEKCRTQLDDCEKLIKEQLLLKKELENAYIDGIKKKEDLENFIKEYNDRISNFDISIDELLILVKENRDQYNEFKELNDSIDNDPFIRDQIASIDNVCQTYNYIKDVLEGKTYQ